MKERNRVRCKDTEKDEKYGIMIIRNIINETVICGKDDFEQLGFSKTFLKSELKIIKN